MAEKNQNIKQRQEERYPEPGIPAEEGWKSMNALLGEAMPPASSPTPPRFPLSSVIATATAIGLAGFAIFLITRNSPDQPLRNTEGHFGTETLQSQVEMGESGTAPTPAQEPASVHEPASVQESVSLKENYLVNAPALSSRAAGRQNAISGEEGRVITHSVHHHSSDTRENAPGNLAVEVVAPEESTGADGKAEATQLQILNMERAYLSPSLTGMQLPVPKSPTLKKEPEISNANVREKRLSGWGLQWMANSPMAGRKTYTSDLKEYHGAYILAIPGVWASGKIGNRQEIVISVRPYFDYYSKNELFFQNNMHDIRPDSIPIPQTYPQGRLLKMRSSSFTVEYHYRFAENFLIGGEFSHQHNWNALASIRRLSPSGFSPAVDSLEWLGKGDYLWSHIRRLNATAGLSLTYRTSSLSLGGSVLLPVFTTSNVPSFNSRPLNARISIRWQLNPPKKTR